MMNPAPSEITHHRIHLAILIMLLIASGLVASPLFDFLLSVQSYAVVDREFAKIELNENSVFAEVVRKDNDLKRGLSGRPSLGSEDGMLFVFPEYGHPAIWMKDMKFPIDIIWIAGGRVVNFAERAKVQAPETPDNELQIYYPDSSANLVLEVNAGYVESHDVRIGDTLAITSEEDLDRALEQKFVENRKEELRLLRSTLSKENLAIETLRKRPYNGNNFTIVKILSENAAYTKYEIRYGSDGLTISGVMNVPKTGKAPYPILILNHGYINPEQYTIGRGSKREQDYFTRRGYVTIHSDYRGYGFSSPAPSALYDFNVGYTIDIMNLVEALKKFKSSTLDPTRIGMWGHSMGGGITERVMVLRNDIKAYVLFAPISSNLNEDIYLVRGLEDIEKEYGFTDETVKLLNDASPFYFLSAVSGAIMIHHGTDDKVVPLRFSQTLNKTLVRNKKTSLLYAYDGEHHEFTKGWPLAMVRSVSFFDQFVKYPKIEKAPSKKAKK
ncbi:MAG: alpha/beta fold hydrolase [Patescibacteria group bacterium]